ncbi:MAG: cytochrome c biogenesis protein CcsA [Chloroflexi bacterium]|nr:cytochrome c biogenesis protein CcsA [Chloroflexota bacterium]
MVHVSPTVDRWARITGVLAAVGLLASLVAIFFYAPAERVQGNVQRIFYVHVPLALNAYVAFFVVFVTSALYLWKRHPRWDVWARASAEVGVVFTTLVLVSGSLWAKPIWGTWWTWDARLTTTLILWLIYVAYLAVRAYATDPEKGARYAAVLGIVGFLDVPIIHQSVKWWRTLHPGPTIVQESGGIGLPPAMLVTFLLALIAFTLLYVFLLLEKVRLEQAKEQVAQYRTAQLI